MFWIDILMAGLVAGLSCLIASLVVKKPKERRLVFAGVLLLCFIPTHFLYTKFIRPEIVAWYHQRTVENALLELPLYKEIKNYDPQSYQLIRREIFAAIKRGQPDDAVSKVRPILFQIGMRYIPLASDDALTNCIGALVRTMDELTQIDPMLTYKWLFPKQYGYVRADKYVKKETTQAMLNSLAEVIRTGASNPVVVKDFGEAETHLEKIRSVLFGKYGKELQVLSDLHSPRIDRKKACQLMIDIYDEVLKLPKRESCIVLRYLFKDHTE
jgi:hypothetical protein